MTSSFLVKLSHPLIEEVNIIENYINSLEAVSKALNSIPLETFKALNMASTAMQQVSSSLLQVENALSSSLVALNDIKINSALSNIYNEVSTSPVDSFVKLSNTVDDFTEPNINQSDNGSGQLSTNSNDCENSSEQNSPTKNVYAFIKSQIEQFKEEQSIKQVEIPDVETCFNFFKFLFHTINTLFLVIGVYDQPAAYAFVEAIITNLDDIFDLRKSHH